MSVKQWEGFVSLLGQNPHLLTNSGKNDWGFSFYLSLTWIRVTKCVFDNPVRIAKNMEGSTHHFFQAFIKKTAEDSYIDGLSRSLKALKIREAPSKPVKSMRKLINFLTETDSEKDSEIPRCFKHHKPMSSDSNWEDVSLALRHSIISDKIFEPLEEEKTFSKAKTKNKKKSKRQ